MLDAGVKSVAWRVAVAVLCFALATNVRLQAQADGGYKSLAGSVICGYQGWQCCPGDAANRGWTHWAIRRDITPSTVNVDYWPDMSYFSGCRQYPASGFRNPDGSQAMLYSPVDSSSVDAQFAMMSKYGIDGVALQCFANGLDKPNGNGGWKTGTDTRFPIVMANVIAAAEAHQRTWCIEYDISGLAQQDIIPVVTHHWTSLVDSGATDSTCYLHQNGRPVVMVFGYFNGDSNHAVAVSPAAYPVGSKLIDWFHEKNKYRAFFIASCAWNWYAIRDPEWIDMMKKPDGLQGWEAGNNPPWNSYADEAKWCAENHQLWLPEVYPGFHWFNLMMNTGRADNARSYVDRQSGRFLWRQFKEASTLGAQSGFVGMFDEFDEGTAIQPVASFPPVGEPPTQWLATVVPGASSTAVPPPWWASNTSRSQFDDNGGMPSDWYLRLTGSATSFFHSGQAIPEAIPIAP